MIHLGDSNLFLALTVEQHSHHAAAAVWFRHLEYSDTLCFCRATHISFLRLLTQAIAPGYRPLTNRQAWAVLDQLHTDEAIGFEAEPDGLDAMWRLLSETDLASPKVWMDAYLASLAIVAQRRLVTFDQDFRRFQSHGLDLLILPTAAHD